jgi:RHS repeat-associated protein
MEKKTEKSREGNSFRGTFHYDPAKNPAQTKSNAIEVPSISLPKGGGALKGVDEKFTVNAVNGTSSFSVVLPVSQARGVTPNLMLTYNSGSGNGIFGLGWSLSLASIKRKTDKGLPRYFDDIDSDVFLFSEAEDLVPEFKKKDDGSFELDEAGDYVISESASADGNHMIRRYRPRIEGAFARIERWRSTGASDIKWRIISKENVTTLFGWSPSARVADPNDSTRIFEWLPEFAFDDRGNCIKYIYKAEDNTGFDASLAYNRNRHTKDAINYVNTYLARVLYCNKTPYKKFGDAMPPNGDFLFETVFDYGTTAEAENPETIHDWDFRPDPFSDYRPGFEIRTTRLCKRVLLFHHFQGTNEYDGLVRAFYFGYNTTSEQDFTFLTSVTSVGFIKKGDGSYSSKKVPSLEFGYQKHEWSGEVKTISREALIHAPAGINEPAYRFVDLFNEGLSGILTEQDRGWYYKHNLGGGNFEQAKLVSPKPSFTGIGSKLQWVDLDADGGKQLVNYGEEPKGFFELDDDNEWQALRNFKGLPNIDLNNPFMRMLDLSGDGKADILITDDKELTWYESLGRNGFSEAKKTVKPFDEEAGPSVVFADQKQTIFLADMSGDGLMDIVRIRRSSVCYWPNLGYGKFGRKITMDNAPLFDDESGFNPAYLRLADIDGSGTTDIIYLGKNKFLCYKNLSGNRFSETPFEIDAFPEIHSLVQVNVTDLLGNGVPCIVWSTALSKHTGTPLQYIDLANSRKPHIMTSYKNNMGKEVSLEYTPSTKFYIDDKLAGKPWVTKLHFPLHCVSRVTIVDKISGYRLVNEYKYHHGYYDHAEREFRGFGEVEQIDAETFEHWEKQDASHVVEAPLNQEPVVSKNWFHTGAYLRKNKMLGQYEKDFWYNEYEREFGAVVHPEITLPDAYLTVPEGMDATLIDSLSADEWREAFRACKGLALRSEIFARDAIKFGNTEEARKKELIPFSATAHNYVIELLQPRGKNKYAVFIARESEAIVYDYERDTQDPRISHHLNIELDEYSNVLESASVVYPRSTADASLSPETQQAQGKTIILYTDNQFTNDVSGNDIHRLRLASDVKTWELKGVASARAFYSVDDFRDILSNTNSDTALYHESNKPLVAGKAQKRLIEHIRTTYQRDDLTGALPLHQLESLALPFENYQLAFTPELIIDIYGTRVDAALLTSGKFAHSEGDSNWWIRSGTIQFKAVPEMQADAQNRFYTPVSYTEPFGGITKAQYYSTYFLFIEKTEDALGNTASVDLFNFRTLSPRRMKDINGNLSEAVSDELGIVKAAAIMGKGSQADDLTGINEFTDAAETTLIDNFLNVGTTVDGISDSIALHNIGKQLLQHATTRFVYDWQAYAVNGRPAVVAAISRETHYRKADGTLSPGTDVQVAFEYSSGGGEVVMKKMQAEPGHAKRVTVQVDNNYTISNVDTGASNLLRWVGTGRTVKNNKGNLVKQYEPYFSVNFNYEDHPELVDTGVTPLLYYDAMGRLVKTVMPDATFTEEVFDSWKHASHDANDTVLNTPWYANRTGRLIDAELLAEGKDPAREKIAADKAALHAETPKVVHFDTLGRPVVLVEHNKNVVTAANEFHRTLIELDVEGNTTKITDARGNGVVRFKYDMLGNLVYQNSMDDGQRWLLNDILDKALRTWDERGHEFQFFYDVAHRPTHSKVIGGDGDITLDHIFERLIYGENFLLPGRINEAALQDQNMLGQVIEHYDTGGLLHTPQYDFSGHPLAVTRKLFSKYKEAANWIDANLANDLEAGNGFTVSAQRDALGRITEQTAPDGSVITPLYNEAGLLESEQVHHAGVINPAVYIKDIDYDEKGRRSKIIYGNDVSTRFYYDKKTFRLLRLETKRQVGDPLQDWHYTYDAFGNVTHIDDKVAPVEFYKNSAVSSLCTYTYDALYRLVEAMGRERNATLNFGACDNWNDLPFTHSLNPADPMAVRNFTQRYRYDAVGNLIEMKHLAAGGNWTRGYEYENTNNRLMRTFIGDNGNPQNYTNYPHHAQHGYLLALPHLEKIAWNFKEELSLTTRQRCTADNVPVITYYQYDGSGQRLRKITENQASGGATPTKKEERIYIGAYELYKKHSGANAGLERKSLSLMEDEHRFVITETRNDVDDGTEKHLVRYQLHNHLGSAALELDPDARVISYEEYHPYGTTAYQARNAAIRSAAKRYRYVGMERDEETGLAYHSARYYLPWLGRWLNADPIGTAGGINVYAYTHSPLVETDTTGRKPKPKTYTAKDGDNLSVIAEKHGVSVPDLKKANNLKTNDIKAGQKLIIPGAKGKDTSKKAGNTAKGNRKAEGGATTAKPAKKAAPKTINIAVIFYHDDIPGGAKSNRNDFGETEAFLIKQGFKIIAVHTGKELVAELGKIAPDTKIKNLVILAHANPGAIGDNSGQGSGIGSDDGNATQQAAGRVSVAAFAKAVPASKFTDDGRLSILGCRTRGGVDDQGVPVAEDNTNLAYRVSRALPGVDVVAANARTSSADSGQSRTATNAYDKSGPKDVLVKGNWKQITTPKGKDPIVKNAPGSSGNKLDLNKSLVK